MDVKLDRILLATDGSGEAELAVHAAADLSTRAGSELHLVYVRPEVPLEPSLPRLAYVERSSEEWTEQDEHEAEQLIRRQAAEAESRGAEVARTYLRRGRPAEEIVDLGAEIGADLLVVGSRGVGTVRRLVVGSVSEGVVSLAPCPVLVVRDTWPPGRVVVGDDASEEARRAGEVALSIAKLLGAPALLVRAYAPRVVSPAARPPATITTDEELLAEGDKAMKERVAELGAESAVRPEFKVDIGDAATVIQKTAEEGGVPTLVAVGSRGLDAVRRFALGSVSTDTLRAVQGPVLVVPSRSVRQ